MANILNNFNLGKNITENRQMPSLTVNAHVLTHTSTHKHGHGVNLDRGGDGDAKENT